MTSKKRLILSYGILALLLAVLFAANLFWGSVSLTPGAVLAALTGRGQDALSVGIITQLRLPRAVMVVLLRAVQLHLDRRACGAFRVGAVLFSNQHGPLGATDTAAQLLNEWKEH